MKLKVADHTIAIDILSSHEAPPSEWGFPEEVCANAHDLKAWLRTQWSTSKQFLEDIDMLHDLDVTITVYRRGLVDPDQLTLDGGPAQLPTQVTSVHF